MPAGKKHACLQASPKNHPRIFYAHNCDRAGTQLPRRHACFLPAGMEKTTVASKFRPNKKVRARMDETRNFRISAQLECALKKNEATVRSYGQVPKMMTIRFYAWFLSPYKIMPNKILRKVCQVPEKQWNSYSLLTTQISSLISKVWPSIGRAVRSIIVNLLDTITNERVII